MKLLWHCTMDAIIDHHVHAEMCHAQIVTCNIFLLNFCNLSHDVGKFLFYVSIFHGKSWIMFSEDITGKNNPTLFLNCITSCILMDIWISIELKETGCFWDKKRVHLLKPYSYHILHTSGTCCTYANLILSQFYSAKGGHQLCYAKRLSQLTQILVSWASAMRKLSRQSQVSLWDSEHSSFGAVALINGDIKAVILLLQG